MKKNKFLHFALIALVLIVGMAMFDKISHYIATDLPADPTLPRLIVPLASSGMKKIVEAHWQGMEVVPLTWELAAKMNIPLNEKGVLIDEVTLYAATSGLRAKDVIKTVSGVPVTNLEEFYGVTRKIRNDNMAVITVMRGRGQTETIDFTVPDIFGFAQLESAPMILAGDIAPHRYRGPCTDCHEIGNTGQLSPDPNAVTLAPPPISKKTKNPHRNRGKCNNCHVVK